MSNRWQLKNGFHCYKVLGNLGNASETVVKTILGLLENNEHNLVVHHNVVKALSKLGNASEALV